MNKKTLNQILFLLFCSATQHDVINAMKRSHAQISNIQQNKQLLPALKKTKLNNKTAAFVCALCNKTFSTKGNLTVHQRTHTGEKLYTCDLCNKSFSRTSELTVHTRMHTGEKPYSCNTCDKAFAQQGHLTIHQITHTGKKSYTCEICNKIFGTSGNLTTHQRIHTEEKPYNCDMCDKSFAHKSNLTTHQRTHTKEKPYSCNICNKSFSQKNHLTKHEKSHIKTITPIINLVKNNTAPMPTQITNDISPKSLNTLLDSQDILDNIMTFNDTEFNKWIEQ